MSIVLLPRLLIAAALGHGDLGLPGVVITGAGLAGRVLALTATTPRPVADAASSSAAMTLPLW